MFGQAAARWAVNARLLRAGVNRVNVTLPQPQFPGSPPSHIRPSRSQKPHSYLNTNHLSMHEFWDIPELVQSVFAFLDDKTRIEAARVCRTFWLNTLPFTWKEVNDFYTLMQLLPDDSMAKGPEDGMEVS